MGKARFLKRILVLELGGFLLVIVILWLNEVLDLPHRLLGALATPTNVMECASESVIVLLLGILAIFSTHVLLKRIKHLEGILPICAFCKKIRAGDSWIPFETYIRDHRDHSEADLSHTACPQCAVEVYGYVLDDEETGL